jgi:protein-S-isoprenylcysteine O-methyltransferase Ste14
MQAILAALALVLMVVIVIGRVVLLRRQGVGAMNFGKTHKTDFLIPPFALFYFYLIFAHAFGLPTVAHSSLFRSGLLAWAGVAFCLAGLLLMLWGVVSFGRSFRVGIDTEYPDRLVTSGVFAFSRNPLYVALACLLLGQFLVFPNWVLLVFLAAGTWLFHRQVLREEAYLKGHYGEEYARYCKKVRRYL